MKPINAYKKAEFKAPETFTSSITILKSQHAFIKKHGLNLSKITRDAIADLERRVKTEKGVL